MRVKRIPIRPKCLYILEPTCSTSDEKAYIVSKWKLVQEKRFYTYEEIAIPKMFFSKKQALLETTIIGMDLYEMQENALNLHLLNYHMTFPQVEAMVKICMSYLRMFN